MESRYRFYFSKLLKYFGQGLLFVAPIGLTIYILVQGFFSLDGIFKFKTPGLGILILLISITFIGYLAPILLTNPIFAYINKIINRTPIVKIIYTSLRDLFSAFVGNKKKFTEPVLIKLSKEIEMERMGFITQKDLSFMGIKGNKVSVYLPFSYGMMGAVYIVPAENVEILNISPTDAMKFIISGGITHTSNVPHSETGDLNK